MNRCVIDANTNELIAYISDSHENIIKDGYEIIEYGCTEPVFEDIDGVVYVKTNSFEIDMRREKEKND